MYLILFCMQCTIIHLDLNVFFHRNGFCFPLYKHQSEFFRSSLVLAEAWDPSSAAGDVSGWLSGPGPLQCLRGRSRPPAPACLGQLSRGYTSDPQLVNPRAIWFIRPRTFSPISGWSPSFMWSARALVCLFAVPLINGVNDWSVLHQHYSERFWLCCVLFGSSAAAHY